MIFNVTLKYCCNISLTIKTQVNSPQLYCLFNLIFTLICWDLHPLTKSFQAQD